MATHDGRLREAVHLADGPVAVEQLLGVRPDALNDLHSRGVPTRVYVPYGADWFRYLAATRGRVPRRLSTVAWVDRYGVVERDDHARARRRARRGCRSESCAARR
jgi:hypothetical protein